MVLYKCEKCNKEFNQKSNYTSHISRKKSCILDDNIKDNIINIETNIILYKCEKCNKEFNKKFNYLSHINKKNPCNCNDLIEENKILLDKIKKLEKIQKTNIVLKNNNTQLEKENIQLKTENEKINELYNNLLNKCISNNTTNNSNNNSNSNNTTTNNTTNNIIKIKLVNFGQEDYTKLTKEEQNNILKYSNRSISNLIKCLHINDKLPQYKNICIKNLRGKGGYLFENNKWTHLNYDVLLMMLFNRKFSDLNKILDENNNENISKFYQDNIQKLIHNFDENNDEFIKKNKDNIINLLYNNTKNYKIE
jgi:DNA-directed RNA polymerase subunit RPC12/RpoP